MRNGTIEEVEKKAFALAVELGLEIYTHDGVTTWRYGQRGSADQYAKTFATAEQAATHFLGTREAQRALEQWQHNAQRLMADSVAVIRGTY